MTVFTKSLLVAFEFFSFFFFFEVALRINLMQTKKNKKKNHSQPPGKCHLHSDADRGTDKNRLSG